MNKRCIVNVATGEFYCKMQQRLIDSFQDSVDLVYHFNIGGNKQPYTSNDHEATGIDLLIWDDILPNNSRPHSESPYGFKIHAIKAAFEKGYTSILWIDSPAYAVKEDISPIFDKIEKEGYYVMSHIDPLETYITRETCDKLAVNYNWIAGKNLPSGSCYGFDLSNIAIQSFFATFARCESLGLFKHEKRHDESILAVLMVGCILPIFTNDPLFQSDSPECVIKSGGL